MTRIDRSPIQGMLERAGAVPCGVCTLPMLPEHPHNHHTDPQAGYDPMPDKPADRDEWVALIKAEYIAEIPVNLHVRQVPSHAEPVAVSQYSAEAAGWVPTGEQVDVLDTGALGSPPWSVPFHRRIGAYRFWEGEVVLSDSELTNAPWRRNLEGIRRWCASSHRTWYEHRGEPLCWLLVQMTMFGGWSTGQGVKELAKQGFAVSPEKAETLLFGWEREDGKHQDGAYDKWWAWVGNDLNGLTLKRVRKPAA